MKLLTSQISPASDKKLNEASRSITAAEEKIAEGESEKNSEWEKVIELFSEFSVDRFIATDGRTLFLSNRQPSPKLDEEKLKRTIFAVYPRSEANKIWNAVTVKRVDSTLLEVAVQRGKVSADIVDQCITVPAPIVSRNHPKWTKEDSEKAVALGITREE